MCLQKTQVIFFFVRERRVERFPCSVPMWQIQGKLKLRTFAPVFPPWNAVTRRLDVTTSLTDLSVQETVIYKNNGFYLSNNAVYFLWAILCVTYMYVMMLNRELKLDDATGPMVVYDFNWEKRHEITEQGMCITELLFFCYHFHAVLPIYKWLKHESFYMYSNFCAVRLMCYKLIDCHQSSAYC